MGSTTESWEIHFTSDIVHTIELSKNAETLPFCSDRSVISILWHLSILIRSTVIGVNDTIPIEVHNIIISGKFHIVACCPCRTTYNIIPCSKITMINVGICLINSMSCASLISRLQRRVITKFHFINRMSHTCIQPGTNTIIKSVVQSQFKFITMAVYLTQISIGSRLSKIRGDSTFTTLH